MSIQTFCVNSGVNYRAFDKWFLNIHKDIVLVVVQTFRMMGIEVLKYFRAFFRKYLYKKCNFWPRHNKQACSVHSLTKSFDEGAAVTSRK
jgi:hypothetical protein